MSHSNSRIRASEAPWGISSLDFDGRLSDWSAVAFGVEDNDQSLSIDQRLFCLGILVFASIPFVFVGACAACLLEG